jgi:hypothetical protein
MTTEVFRSGLMAPGSPQASSGGLHAGTVYPGAVHPEAAAQPSRTLWQTLEATARAFPHTAAIDDGKSVLPGGPGGGSPMEMVRS